MDDITLGELREGLRLVEALRATGEAPYPTAEACNEAARRGRLWVHWAEDHAEAMAREVLTCMEAEAEQPVELPRLEVFGSPEMGDVLVRVDPDTTREMAVPEAAEVVRRCADYPRLRAQAAAGSFDRGAEAMREACIAVVRGIFRDCAAGGGSESVVRHAAEAEAAIRDLPVPAPAVPVATATTAEWIASLVQDLEDEIARRKRGPGGQTTGPSDLAGWNHAALSAMHRWCRNAQATLSAPAPAVKYRGPCAHCGGHVAGCAVCQGDGDPLPPVPASDPCTVCNGTGADCRHYPIQGCTCEVVPAPAADAVAVEREACIAALERLGTLAGRNDCIAAIRRRGGR
jgi:hypothetical protein